MGMILIIMKYIIVLFILFLAALVIAKTIIKLEKMEDEYLRKREERERGKQWKA